MYDIRQFKPALYVLVLLGITGFALASESPGTWVLATLMILANAWLIRENMFRPVPRLLSNVVTLTATGFLFTQLTAHVTSPLLLIGQFLVVLQVVKVWEQRANRDYAQLLVLSLLLMVAAAISTASLLFGLLLIVYLVLSLYCCLLFHLKVETDEAKSSMDLTADASGALRQDQRFLSRSMRRLTSLITSFSVTAAIAVFLLFPRGTGAGMFGELRWKPRDTLTGFSEQVSFQQVAKITQNNEPVASVQLWKDDKLVPGTSALLLRGVTHDTYYGSSGDDRHNAYSWGNSQEVLSKQATGDVDTDQMPWLVPGAIGVGRYREEVTLAPTGTDVLFATAGPLAIELSKSGTTRHLTLHYNPFDRTLSTADPLNKPVKYIVSASGSLGRADLVNTPIAPSRIDPLIAQYARRAEVSGPGLVQRRAALLGAQSNSEVPAPTAVDEQIAENISHHLQSTFQYTLDLTQESQWGKRDPMVAFLYDFKKGHCEYFAGAMTLMCQSLGIRSRMVVGFRCDDYNPYGHYYTVRQSQAHAWVEVLTANGWMTFDPTSGRELLGSQASLLQKSKHFLDFLEYTWANSVIAYDAANRDNLINAVDGKITNSAINGSVAFSSIRPLMEKIAGVIATMVVEPLMIILTVGMVGSIGWFAWERWKLWRRAARIGLDTLPLNDQARLLRQLGFYDDLLQLLEKRQIVRREAPDADGVQRVADVPAERAVQRDPPVDEPVLSHPLRPSRARPGPAAQARRRDRALGRGLGRRISNSRLTPCAAWSLQRPGSRSRPTCSLKRPGRGSISLARHVRQRRLHVADLDRGADEVAPLGPRAVVVFHVAHAEQVLQHEPRVAAALADAAVAHGRLAQVDARLRVQRPQLVDGLERAVVIDALGPGDVLRAGDVPGPLGGLGHARRGDDLAGELVRAAHVDQVLRLLPQQRFDLPAVRPQRLVGRRNGIFAPLEVGLLL